MNECGYEAGLAGRFGQASGKLVGLVDNGGGERDRHGPFDTDNDGISGTNDKVGVKNRKMDGSWHFL